MPNLYLRILTAVVGIPLVVVLLYFGGWAFALVLIAAALAAQYELYGLMEQGGLRPQKVFGLLLGLSLALRPLFAGADAVFLFGALVLVALLPFRTEERPLPNLGGTLLGAIYPTAFLAFVLHLRLSSGPLIADREAFWLTLSVFLLIWATDSCAYFAGRAVGRRPLAPTVSPKKTWEGAIGGAAGALVVAALLGFTVLQFLPWLHLLVVAFICGVLSPMGDLAESWIKRSVGAKDSGNLLPGHGGMLDRLDALILAVPLAYLYLAHVARVLE